MTHNALKRDQKVGAEINGLEKRDKQRFQNAINSMQIQSSGCKGDQRYAKTIPGLQKQSAVCKNNQRFANAINGLQKKNKQRLAKANND